MGYRRGGDDFRMQQRGGPPAPAPAPAPAEAGGDGGGTRVRDLTDKQARSLKGTLNEFMNIKDNNEVKCCVEEYKLPNNAVWVEGTILYAINDLKFKDSAGRQSLMDMLNYLVKEGALTKS